VLEVPSGVWADTVSRRRLLVLAPLLSGTGFAAWTVAPGYPAFALGFVLWGAQGALQSGALEALVYEELDRVGAAHRYARVMGRATALATIAACAAMGLAAPAFAAGGFSTVGAASVLACLAAAAVAATFPEHPRPAGDGDNDGAPLAPLRAGLREACGSRALGAALVAAAAVAAVWGSLDEYLPLLAIESGAAPTTVPLLGLLIYGAMAVGGLAAWRAQRLGGRGLAAVLLAAAAMLAAGALVRVPSGFVLIAPAFCLFQVATVVADARLQDAIEGPARATVTSLSGLLTEVLALAVFAGYALGSTVASHAMLFAVAAATYVAIAALVARRPRSTIGGRRTGQ
jgi:predicted MFS family arabinose efflux permease